MRITFLLAVLIIAFSACKKDKYTTEPQIKFKDLNPDFASSDLTSINKDLAPKLVLEVTDADGDLGLIGGSDTSRIYIKNLLKFTVDPLTSIDSFDFPNLQTSTSKNFKATIEVNLFNALECINFSPPRARPRTDTLYFEVYVKDFAGNKSNVIVTDRPVYYRCL